MMSNTFGRLFRLTTFGESHGVGLGGIVDGCPAGLELSEEDIQKELDARKPGGTAGSASTKRREADRVRLLSGLLKGRTTGAPIAFFVENQDQKSDDYQSLADTFRPGHADLGFTTKYGFRDHRGGGRSSGRETVSRVAGGAIALNFLATQGVQVHACTLELGGIQASLTDIAGARERPYFCPEDQTASLWEHACMKARHEGDTLGGLVRVEIYGLPAGLGEPVFDKLDARLAYALMGVGAVKGVEIGSGFTSSRGSGSINNDPILPLDAAAIEKKAGECPIAATGQLPGGAGFAFGTNNAGGILGGISNGAPVIVTAAIKPIASISSQQQTIDASGKPRLLSVGGRHDVCAIPRIVPVLRAMVALCAADFILLQRAAQV